jgi:hypothetical protein
VLLAHLSMMAVVSAPSRRFPLESSANSVRILAAEERDHCAKNVPNTQPPSVIRHPTPTKDSQNSLSEIAEFARRFAPISDSKSRSLNGECGFNSLLRQSIDQCTNRSIDQFADQLPNSGRAERDSKVDKVRGS